ncbi:hypothetical protein NMG60_11031929 [Bertholletia excelsa]
MGSLASHFTRFIFFFPLGIRRLLSSSSLYVKNPVSFRSKPWYLSEPKWKNFDFYVLLITLPIASLSEFFFFLVFSGNHAHQFSYLQQSAVVSLFWVLVILIIVRESFDSFAIPENFVFIFAGISFLIDYMSMGQGVTGLGSVAYQLLGGLTLLCAGSCLYLAFRPVAFFAEFFLSSGLMFKGTWALQSGLSLYTDTFVFKGCDKIPISPAERIIEMKCVLEEDSLRGIALMNLLFIGHAMVVLITSFALFAVLSSKWNLRRGESGMLANLESDSMIQMRPLPEFEID